MGQGAPPGHGGRHVSGLHRLPQARQQQRWRALLACIAGVQCWRAVLAYSARVSKLYFRYAAMNAGKSTALLQVAYNYEERGMRVRLFTAAHDDRMGRGLIGSRLGLTRPADTFGATTAFDRAGLGSVQGSTQSSAKSSAKSTGPVADPTAPLACVLIDEAQFLTPQQVCQLHRMAHAEHLPVICFGLRSDFRGEAFAGSAMLMTLADDIEEMKTICACARKATMNIRIDAAGRRVQAGEQIEIGGNERYRAVCPSCFYADDEGGAEQAPGLFG